MHGAMRFASGCLVSLQTAPEQATLPGLSLVRTIAVDRQFVARPHGKKRLPPLSVTVYRDKLPQLQENAIDFIRYGKARVGRLSGHEISSGRYCSPGLAQRVVTQAMSQGVEIAYTTDCPISLHIDSTFVYVQCDWWWLSVGTSETSGP